MAGEVFDASGNNPNPIGNSGSISGHGSGEGIVIVPNDDVDLARVTRGVYVGGIGDLTVEFANAPPGVAVLLSAVPVGTVLPIQVRRIHDTNTTATLIVALF